MGPGRPRINAAFLVMQPIYIGVSKSNILRWELFMRLSKIREIWVYRLLIG